MSSSNGPSQPGEDRQEGFSKYLKRMKTILKRSPTARSSISSMQEITERPEPSQVASPRPTPAPAQKPAAKPTTQPTVVTHWSAIQEEKARALFAKYGLTIESGEWKTPSDMTVQRVAKPIRMRVRRTCHRCETTFGPDKVCVNCQHIRCTKCPRHTSSKPNDQAQNALETIRAAQGHGPPRHKSKELQLTIPSRTGGQDLVLKPIRQRVRRTCHRPKPHKYPDGYPGDAEPPSEPPARTWKKPRQRVRYTCHKCSTQYRSRETTCSNCGQEKGPETIRDPPKKNKPEPDPEILRRVEERLANMSATK
ncbi:hypothetical protein ALT_6929 [Aspergillus lentulus]|uniref:Uncharacterized protein n=1 Tax=Aspergillus lentulus TaxID=293939 RepID=A0AAN5YRQ1_ASPLE|nr:hypothetical protein CNMCM7927_005704 [Aspergillus lentulus]KAF4206634.1 hypothetical protein CNMCM8927_004614 [Aspergillus lentulus]GAQ09608.1 hypothetical protein ALT_6929 [Aspergillus lentulus]